ncbi:uncharacterized protein UV8b_01935 [Ustilaginoidea virens]|uniref:Uncharacterized protein n=1 Tax=Ustilaginoidea virens TaxID=1159556 RepID=A0A8E5HLP6_USTVR|nr:uncharacterized protein UV8b_01935 [Ustilaginoidea virens]QUC17694.1 hypothetical protein UV8b_01935 [Ustilaginoidea virens]
MPGGCERFRESIGLVFIEIRVVGPCKLANHADSAEHLEPLRTEQVLGRAQRFGCPPLTGMHVSNRDVRSNHTTA